MKLIVKKLDVINCRGPAPVDPGNSKGRWLQQSGYDRIKDIKSG